MTTQTSSEKPAAPPRPAEAPEAASAPQAALFKPSHLHWGTYHRKPISFTFIFMIVSVFVIWFASYKITNWYNLGSNGILSNSRMYIVCYSGLSS